jgi:4-diphosphocytidyl-2-C-methyl-D-erythritol kinase
VKLFAPAKINLTLEILGKRGDGYHEIATLFQAISRCDGLDIDWNASELSFSCSDLSLPLDENNLVLKAVRVVEAYVGQKIHAAIHLEKNIPAGAGLGGGSSDAAAVLLALGKRFAITEEALFGMAEKLGADVPFFLKGGTALGKGKGERLEFLPSLPTYFVVVVKPPFSIPTPLAYSLVQDYSSGEKTMMAVKALREGRFESFFECMTNDFEKVLFPHYPDLAKIKHCFLKNGALSALLSGSGSALFAFAANEKEAEKHAKGVESFGKVWICKT